MNIIICDDNSLCLERVYQVCKNADVAEMNIEKYSSSEELYNVIIKEKPKVDLFVLDIEMPNVSGLDLKNVIYENYSDTNIAFITSHPQVMQEAFGKFVRAFFTRDRDEHKIPMLINEIFCELGAGDVIDVDDGMERIAIKKSDIVKIEAEHVYSKLYLGKELNGNIEIYDTKIMRISMNKWESLLKENDFYRVGRSLIINLSFVRKITDVIIMEDNSQVKIPVRKVAQLKRAYNSYCSKMARSVW